MADRYVKAPSECLGGEAWASWLARVGPTADSLGEAGATIGGIPSYNAAIVFHKFEGVRGAKGAFNATPLPGVVAYGAALIHHNERTASDLVVRCVTARSGDTGSLAPSLCQPPVLPSPRPRAVPCTPVIVSTKLLHMCL
jgi:hypothetical protein